MKTVLIVEDNAEWRVLLAMVVKRAGYEVIAATTGREGWSQAVCHHPDLILMDLGLPEMSGDEATVKIKADPTTRDIPIIIQTAYGTTESAKRAVAAGAVEIMHKPITIAEIQAVLKKHVPLVPMRSTV